MPKMKRQTRPPVRFAEAHFMGSYDRTAGGTLPPPPTTAVSAGREHAHQSQFQAGRMLHLRLSAQNRTGTQAHPARPPAHSPSYIFDAVCVCVLTPDRACTHLRPCLPCATLQRQPQILLTRLLSKILLTRCLLSFLAISRQPRSTLDTCASFWPSQL
jgi:hypothetical protein